MHIAQSSFDVCWSVFRLQAYRNNMVGPGYAWMLVGWYSKKWWEEDDDSVTCSKEELRKAVESSYYIATEALQLSTSPDITVANIVSYRPGQLFSLLHIKSCLFYTNIEMTGDGQSLKFGSPEL